MDFFHVVMCILASFGSFHGSTAHFFLLLNNIPLSGWARVYVSIPLRRDISAALKSWRFSEQQGHSLTLLPGAFGILGLQAGPNTPVASG